MESELEVKMLDEKRAIVVVPEESLAYLIEQNPLGFSVIKKLPKKEITELLTEAGSRSFKKLGEIIEKIRKKKE